MQHRDAVRPILLLAGWLLLTTTLSAQGLAGVWSSSFYRVQLAVSGSSVTGSFTSLDDPQAKPGTITGQLQPGGRGFTADWTYPTAFETGRFKTSLALGRSDGVLSGYRWTDDAPPSSFGLHRAVNGQLVQVISQDSPAGTSASTTTTPTSIPPPSTTTVPTTGGTTNQPPAYRFEVITCESVVNGEPHNVGTQFTAPKSVAALVRYGNLPPNSTIDWLWTLDGRTESKLTKTLGGTGWHMHGIRSDLALVPGTYLLTVSLNKQPLARRTITIKPAAATAAPPTTGSVSAQPGLEVIICESAAGGVPQNAARQFTKPKSLVCLVKHRDLPDNTELKWLWQRPNGTTTPYVKTVSGTGWATHGFTNPTGMTPGTYKITICAAGREVTTVTVVVR